MKNVDFPLVLQGCPRKMLICHWFYKVVHGKCWFYIVFTRLSRKMFILQWFYKVVHGKCWFYIGFARLSTENVDFTLVLQGCPWKMLILHWFLKEISRTTRGQPQHGFGAEQEQQEQHNFCLRTALAPESYRPRSFASPARTHERNETISQLGSQGLTPPTSNIPIRPPFGW